MSSPSLRRRFLTKVRIAPTLAHPGQTVPQGLDLQVASIGLVHVSPSFRAAARRRTCLTGANPAAVFRLGTIYLTPTRCKAFPFLYPRHPVVLLVQFTKTG